MTHVTCRLTAKNRDQLRNPALGNRVWATFTFITGRCYSSAVLAMALCPSVSVSVCLSQVGVLLKRLNVGSHKQTTRYPGTRFLLPTISAKFDRGHPVRGRQMQMGWVKIGDFRQITSYISKTVQEKSMVSTKVE